MHYLSLVLGFIAGACGSLILWVTLGRKLIMSYAGKSVINRICNPDEDTKQALQALLGQAWAWFLTPSIKTGQKIQNEDGTESDEIISPFQNLASEISRYAVMRIKGMSGAEAKKIRVLQEAIQSDLAQSDLGAALRSMLPKAFDLAMKKGDYTPLLLQMVAPMIDKLINVKKDDTINKNW